MISLGHVERAAVIIRPFVLKTPLVFSPTFSRMYGSDIYLKLENLQKTGSFKIRGAAHKLLANTRHIKSGVWWRHQRATTPRVLLWRPGTPVSRPQSSCPVGVHSKQEATQNYGGRVILHGESVGESLEKAREIEDQGKTFIHPFDDEDIIAGQGTIALEILEELSDTDMMVIPIGGGGLIAGMAVAAKSIKPGITIIGVQAAACPSMAESVKSGEIQKVASTPSSPTASASVNPVAFPMRSLHNLLMI